MSDRDPSAPDERDSTIRVEDKRHWARAEESPDTTEEGPEPSPTVPTVVADLQRRADAAERKLQDYIAAFRQAQTEQEQVRERLARDVDRRVQVEFGALVADLLDCVDDLDLALAHAAGRPEAEALARGVALARDRFIGALERAGVVRFTLDGTPFDPNVAEAMRMVPVDTPERDGTVVETLRPGYMLGERMLRPARVAVGRHGE